MDPKLTALLVSLGLVAEQDATALDDLAALSADQLLAVRGAIGRVLDDIRTEVRNGTAGGDEQLQLAAAGTAAYSALNTEIDRRRADDDSRAAMVAELIASAIGDRNVATEAPTVASARPALPKLSQVNRGRMPRSARPILTQQGPEVLTASGAPAPDSSLHGLVNRTMLNELRADLPDERVMLARLKAEFPDDLMVTADASLTEEKLTAASSMVASGGPCGPLPSIYDVMSVSDAARPVRDGLVSLGAPRGGVRFFSPVTLAAVHALGPASVWTAATDIAPGGSTKPHAVFSCPTVTEVTVDAVTNITEFSNFSMKFSPEAVAQFVDTTMSEHSRLAESTILKKISDGSTKTVAGVNLLGATREILPAIDRAAAALRFRHRTRREAPLTLIWPEYADDLLRADLARQLPGDSGGPRERLAVTDAEIDEWFAVRSITLIRALDSPTGAPTFQGWISQSVGDLLPWPTKIQCWLYPSGSWYLLDGGELNLGVVRDSTLNATNRLQMWSETFELAFFRGVESLELTIDCCPSGATAGTQDSTGYCLSGS